LLLRNDWKLCETKKSIQLTDHYGHQRNIDTKDMPSQAHPSFEGVPENLSDRQENM
jgi:hypothetical protein